MQQKRVLFLGGAYSQIPILEEAKRRGWYIITCDYLPNNPGHKLANEYYNISTTDRLKVLNLAQKLKPDFIVAYASDPAAPIAAYVSEELGLPGNTYKSVELLSEKDLFRNFLSENNFNVPLHISFKDGIINYDSLQKLHFPIIVKPTDSSGSKGVGKVEEINDIAKAVDYALKFSRNKRIIVEEFIEADKSQLHGDGFVRNGELIFCHLGEHHYNKEINPFVPYSTTWPAEISNEKVLLAIQETSRAIKLSGFKNGAVNIEVRLTKEGKVYIMEIGPRSGGNFVPQAIKYSTGFDMVKAYLDSFVSTEIDVNAVNEVPSAYYVIHSKSDGILSSITINNYLKPFIKEFHQYKKEGEKVKSFQGANAAIGLLLLSFPNKEEMHKCINNMNELIELKIKSIRD